MMMMILMLTSSAKKKKRRLLGLRGGSRVCSRLDGWLASGDSKCSAESTRDKRPEGGKRKEGLDALSKSRTKMRENQSELFFFPPLLTWSSYSPSSHTLLASINIPSFDFLSSSLQTPPRNGHLRRQAPRQRRYARRAQRQEGPAGRAGELVEENAATKGIESLDMFFDFKCSFFPFSLSPLPHPPRFLPQSSPSTESSRSRRSPGTSPRSRPLTELRSASP